VKLQSEPDGFSDVQIFDPATLLPQASFIAFYQQVTQFASHWHEHCIKDYEFENTIKK